MEAIETTIQAQYFTLRIDPVLYEDWAMLDQEVQEAKQAATVCKNRIAQLESKQPRDPQGVAQWVEELRSLREQYPVLIEVARQKEEAYRSSDTYRQVAILVKQHREQVQREALRTRDQVIIPAKEQAEAAILAAQVAKQEFQKTVGDAYARYYAMTSDTTPIKILPSGGSQ